MVAPTLAAMLDDLVADAVDDGDEAIEELAEIAAESPEEVRPFLSRLLAAGVVSPYMLYRAADDEVCHALVRLLDADPEQPWLLHGCRRLDSDDDTSVNSHGRAAEQEA